MPVTKRRSSKPLESSDAPRSSEEEEKTESKSVSSSKAPILATTGIIPARLTFMSSLLLRSAAILRLSPLLSLVVVFLVSFVSGLSSETMPPQSSIRNEKMADTMMFNAAPPMMGMASPMRAHAMRAGVGSAPNMQYEEYDSSSSSSSYTSSPPSSSSPYADDVAGVGAEIASSLRGEDGKASFDAAVVERMLVWTGNVNFAAKEGTGAYDKISEAISLCRDKLDKEVSGSSYVENENERTNVNFLYPECIDSQGNWKNCRDYHRLSPAAKALLPLDPTKPIQVKVRSRSLTLRVPTPSFPDVFSTLLSLPSSLAPSTSRVSESSSSAHDVTADYVDVASRASTLERTQNALEKLMSAASSTQDVMSIMRELNKVTSEIESAKQRMKYLKKASNLSTLNLRIDEEAPAAPVVVFPEESDRDDDKNKGWDPARTLKKAVRLFGFALTRAADSAIFTAVFGGPLALALFGLVKLLGKRGQGWGALP